MKKKNLLFYFCLFLSFFLHAQDPQQNFLDSLSGRFITEIRKQGKPRALLVTDKSIFKAGETIWFRGFLVNSVSQKIGSQSKYLFVDLVNEKDSVITAVILDAANLQLNSRIVLTDAVSEGNYWLRAYTRHMAEGDSNSIFVKPIYVAGRMKGKDKSKQEDFSFSFAIFITSVIYSLFLILKFFLNQVQVCLRDTSKLFSF